MATALPTEVLERIVAYVRSSDLYASTSPHPSGADLDYKLKLTSDPNKDLQSLALAGAPLRPVVRRAPVLRTFVAFNLFADAISLPPEGHDNDPASPSRAASIRAIMLRDDEIPYRRKLKSHYWLFKNLRSLFDHATQLDVLAFETHEVAMLFFRDRSVCRPRRLTISGRQGLWTPPAGDLASCAPLSRLTHLHLMGANPRLAFIGCLGDEDERQQRLGRPVPSCEALECLRLSHLYWGGLMHFEAWVEWSEGEDAEYDDWEFDEDQELPRSVGVSERRLLLQSSLSRLARRGARLRRFRLMLLDFRREWNNPLKSPFQQEKEAARSSSGRVKQAEASFKPRRAQPADAHYFHAAMRTVHDLCAAEVSDANASDATRPYPERKRTGDADDYWRKTESGKHAYERLWAQYCEQPPELRIVLGKKGDLLLDETDFYCQIAPGADEADVGCWADPDVFDLVTRSPYLSYRLDESGKGWYWTGELPRSTTRDGVTTYIPSWIPIDNPESLQ